LIAYTGEPLEQPWWQAPVIVDLDGIDAGDGVFPILDAHLQTKEGIVGQAEEAVVEDGKFIVRGRMIEVMDAAKEIIRLADASFVWQASIGARSYQKEFVGEGATVEVNGRTYQGPCYVSRKTVIRETSFVVIGDDKNTKGLVASYRGTMAKMTFAEYCKANDFDEDKLTASQKKALQAAHAALDDDEGDGGDDSGEGDGEGKTAKAAATQLPIRAAGGDGAREPGTLKDYRKQQADEDKRVREIRQITAGNPDLEGEITADGKTTKANIREHAIRTCMTVEATRHLFELTELRAARAGGGGVNAPLTWYSPQTPQLSEAVVEAAVLQAGNCRLELDSFHREQNVPESVRRRVQTEMRARYTDQVQQAAHTLFRGRVGLKQVLLAGASMAGKHYGTIDCDSDIANVLRACNWEQSDPNVIRADGASTASIANVLANVLNKFLLSGYLYTEMTWREICGIRPVKDFKPTKSINLFADVMFKQVNQDGELAHGVIQDQAFANQAATYGRILSLTRKHIIDDDLNALTTLPQLMGRGAGLKINDVFWTLFNNPGNDEGGSTAFWAATHTITGQSGNANYFSGASTNLQSTSLDTAVLTFRQQVDPKNFPLGVAPSILLYPPELEGIAWQLLNSTLLITGSTGKNPADNQWKSRFTPAQSAYLSNSNYTGYSTTAWYLLANPNIIPVIEACFLNGQEQPTVQTAQADFNRLGVDMRGFSDFGVSMQNFRGGVKSKGAA
jgi:hypothetical protein